MCKTSRSIYTPKAMNCFMNHEPTVRIEARFRTCMALDSAANPKRPSV